MNRNFKSLALISALSAAFVTVGAAGCSDTSSDPIHNVGTGDAAAFDAGDTDAADNDASDTDATTDAGSDADSDAATDADAGACLGEEKPNVVACAVSSEGCLSSQVRVDECTNISVSLKESVAAAVQSCFNETTSVACTDAAFAACSNDAIARACSDETETNATCTLLNEVAECGSGQVFPISECQALVPALSERGLSRLYNCIEQEGVGCGEAIEPCFNAAYLDTTYDDPI